MSVRSKSYLSVLLALSLAGACGSDEPATDQTDDSVGNEDDEDGDDDTGKTSEDDEDTTGDDSADPVDAGKVTPPPPKDSAVSKPMDASSDAGALPARDAGSARDAGDSGSPSASDGGGAPVLADGECCEDKNCLCHGDPPNALTSSRGPYKYESYALAGAGCVYYPSDDAAKAPFAAVTISDGAGGSGGCGRTQTDQWGPLYASWGIVAMIVNTTGGDQPATRGQKLITGVKAFKSENEKSGSPLYQKLAGRYGTSGFSMGGGGTSFASVTDPMLKTSVAIMPWGPTRSKINVPTLVICGSSDNIAPCSQHGNSLYGLVSNDLPKMRVTVQSSHAGQPTAGSGKSGQYGLAFQKVYLEGDQRWKKLLVDADSEQTTIK